jgi:Thioredoxin-like domain
LWPACVVIICMTKPTSSLDCLAATRCTNVKTAKAGTPLAYICANTAHERKELAELVRSIAIKYRDVIKFVTLNTQTFGYHAYQLGLDIDQLPGFVIRDFLGKTTFPLDQGTQITPTSVDEFIAALLL